MLLKSLKSLEDPGVLIDRVTETGRWIYWNLVSTFSPSIVQPVISSVVKGISGRGVRRAGREYMNKIF